MLGLKISQLYYINNINKFAWKTKFIQIIYYLRILDKIKIISKYCHYSAPSGQHTKLISTIPMAMSHKIQKERN